ARRRGEDVLLREPFSGSPKNATALELFRCATVLLLRASLRSTTGVRVIRAAGWLSVRPSRKTRSVAFFLIVEGCLQRLAAQDVFPALIGAHRGFRPMSRHIHRQ